MPERGELLLIPFPFSDLSATKRRPVLALTTSDDYGDFIALPVTSRPQTEHGLPIASSDLVEGSLPAPSWIRTNRIVTLNKSLVSNESGVFRNVRLEKPSAVSVSILAGLPIHRRKSAARNGTCIIAVNTMERSDYAKCPDKTDGEKRLRGADLDPHTHGRARRRLADAPH